MLLTAYGTLKLLGLQKFIYDGIKFWRLQLNFEA